MANTISIKKNTTKTLTIKKDTVIDFTEVDNINNFTFTKSKKNLIIADTVNGIKLTVKNYFSNADYDYSTSKLSALTFKGQNKTLLSSTTVKEKANYGQNVYNYNKKLAVYGTTFADNINLNDNNFVNCLAGSGNDTIVGNKNKSDLIVTGEGNNTVTYDWRNVHNTSHYIDLGDGSNTIIINTNGLYDDNETEKDFVVYKDGTLRLRDFNDNYLYIVGYLKNGQNKDIKIQVNTPGNVQHDGRTGRNDSSHKTVDLQYYFNRELNVLNERRSLFGFGNYWSAKKKQKLVGNFLNNNFECSKYGDKVYCIDGENLVYNSEGNDKIYCGKGKDNIIQWLGSDYVMGKDTIYNSTKETRIRLMDYSGKISANSFKYYKSGNNLLMQHYNETTKKTDQFTIADYFKPDKGKSINDKDRLRYIYNYNNSISGMHYDDATFYSVDLRNIEITATMSKKSETMHLGYGKFKIVPNGGSAKIVLHKTSTADIAFGDKQGFDTNNITKNGDDLVLNYLSNGKKKGTIAIQDYFNSSAEGKSKIGEMKPTYSLNSNVKTNISDILSGDKTINVTGYSEYKNGFYYIHGLESYNNNITGTKKNDRIYAYNSKTNIIDSGAGNDVIHTQTGGNKTTIYYSGGFDNCITGTNSDTYNVGATSKKKTGFSKDSKLLINDQGGADTMNISAKTKDLRVLFNVDSDGNIITTATEAFLRSDDKKTDSLLIFNKSALTGKNLQKMIKNNGFSGAVEIDKALTSEGYKGNGKIETINSNDSQGIDMNNWINAVKGEVVNWLKANNKGSVAEVLNGTDKKAINSLINVFAGKAYQ